MLGQSAAFSVQPLSFSAQLFFPSSLPLLSDSEVVHYLSLLLHTASPPALLHHYQLVRVPGTFPLGLSAQWRQVDTQL